MKALDYSARIIGLARVIYDWRNTLRTFSKDERGEIARYCDAVAATLERAADALEQVLLAPGDPGVNLRARQAAAREFGRMTGYVEDIAGLLEGHLDGRKIAGVKRRLSSLVAFKSGRSRLALASDKPVLQVREAEGYFRALADRLRA